MKTKSTAVMLTLFLGGIGIHHFYLGNSIRGVIYALFFWTFIPILLSILELISLLSTSNEQFNSKYNGHSMPSEDAGRASDTSARRDTTRQLGELYSLKEKGAISSEEYEIGKRQILDSAQARKTG
jgi:TM2 domain-containing membrane protein YozV